MVSLVVHGITNPRLVRWWLSALVQAGYLSPFSAFSATGIPSWVMPDCIFTMKGEGVSANRPSGQ